MQPFSSVCHRHSKARFDHHHGRRCFLEVQIAVVILHIVFSLVSKEMCAQSRAMPNQPNMWRIHVQEILCAGKTRKPGFHARLTVESRPKWMWQVCCHVLVTWAMSKCIRKKVLHAHMSHTHQLLAGEWCSIVYTQPCPEICIHPIQPTSHDVFVIQKALTYFSGSYTF